MQKILFSNDCSASSIQQVLLISHCPLYNLKLPNSVCVCMKIEVDPTQPQVHVHYNKWFIPNEKRADHWLLVEKWTLLLLEA